MKPRIFLIASGLLATGCIIAGLLAGDWSTPLKPAGQNIATTQPVQKMPEEVAVAPQVEVTNQAAKASGMPTETAIQPKSKKQNGGNSVKPPKAALQDPDARLALSLVGVDAEAEQYWMTAIFNPNLPEEERADLMEDLNEEGLADPKHPTPEDLILIANRLGPIEDAMQGADPFMQEHLAEAYKDLLNLLAGKPAQ